ncbi:type II toxin-antitoxin system RelE/ParE family toxin [Vibrio breoganii]|uniref:Type II toxin-antitoxin system RelE/ParE family toxin n=1 Tax=Vibrio breoganii TaxID=553239 RepID=A0ABX1UCE8_9VIBR|nr:type II toxin-antitoxin system RelE/ParE family toxin [Vibrio breoganii]NMO74101.1 type II toxin-antitoxin system RelE/ParE family toxin [Vibrio breoganii]NMR70846.1 type II toxin-antitoxin system RelE/ParE family toxin [Vibrio breoganii]PML88163.1 addiction module toxin RelE [Vibrio breoganii]PMP05109.1 addiction module toxin RelE [Vibrio breoganii]
MCEEQRNIDIYESRRFEKALAKLPDTLLTIVEDEIEKIVEHPEIGEQKKGDLSHMRVHKFQLNNQLALLGDSWVENKLEIYLLHLDSHET